MQLRRMKIAYMPIKWDNIRSTSRKAFIGNADMNKLGEIAPKGGNNNG